MDLSDPKLSRQYALEKWWVESSRDKEVEYIDLLRESGRASTDRGVRSLITSLAERLSLEIAERVTQESIDKVRRKSYFYLRKLTKSIEPYELAYLILMTTVNKLAFPGKPVSLAALGGVLSEAVSEEIRFRAMVALEPKLPREVDKVLKGKAHTFKHAKRVMINLFNRKVDAKIPKIFQDQQTKVETGNALLELLLTDQGASLIRVENWKTGTVERTRVRLTDAVEKLLKREADLNWLADRTSPFGILTYEPTRRTVSNHHQKETLLTREQPTIKVNALGGKNPEHLETLFSKGYGIQLLLGSLSALEMVPWEINQPMLTWVNSRLMELRRAGILTDLSFREFPKPDPSEIEAFREWKRLTAGEYNRLYKQRIKLMKENTCLRLAKRLADEPEFYYRWYADFRGRLYPTNNSLSIQGGPLAKSLLAFKVPGKVKVGTADAGWWDFVEYGMRLTKTYEKSPGELIGPLVIDRTILTQMSELSEGSLSDISVWCDTKNVLPFVAWLLELKRMLPNWGKWDTTGLPLRKDATCSSLQHMAALCGDKRVMELTNVMENPNNTNIRDLYSEFYPKYLEEGLTRADLKTFIMTLAYNSTDYSRKINLRGLHPEMPYQEVAEVNSRIKKAAEVGLKRIMTLRKLLGDTLKHIFESDTLATSITLTGFVVNSTKHNFPSKRYNLYSASLRFSRRIRISYKNLEDMEGSPIDRRKTANAWVANLVHSMDAALLHVFLSGVIGIKDNLQRPHVGFIHDCVVTRAGDMDTCTSGLASAFKRLYRPSTHGLSASLWRLVEYWALEEDNPDLYAEFLKLKAVDLENYKMPYLFV